MIGRMVLILKNKETKQNTKHKIVSRSCFGIGHGIEFELLVEQVQRKGLADSSEAWKMWHWSPGG